MTAITAYNLGIDVDTSDVNRLISRLAKLKSTIIIENGGAPHVY